jgi:hypothetical protein
MRPSTLSFGRNEDSIQKSNTTTEEFIVEKHNLLKPQWIPRAFLAI